MDKDEKLMAFLDSLGQDSDVDFARQMLEVHDWNLEAALITVTGGDTAPAPSVTEHGLPPDYVDEDGYRAPMRTGYTDQLLGPSPEELVWQQAAVGGHHSSAHEDDQAFAFLDRDAAVADRELRQHRSRNDEDVRQAMRASQEEHLRMADHREQGALAEALQASYADYNAAEQMRVQQSFRDQSEEQRLIAQAIEASYKEQSNADAQYRAQLKKAMAASRGQDTATAPAGRSSPGGRVSPALGLSSPSRSSPSGRVSPTGTSSSTLRASNAATRPSRASQDLSRAVASSGDRFLQQRAERSALSSQSASGPSQRRPSSDVVPVQSRYTSETRPSASSAGGSSSQVRPGAVAGSRSVAGSSGSTSKPLAPRSAVGSSGTSGGSSSSSYSMGVRAERRRDPASGAGPSSAFSTFARSHGATDKRPSAPDMPRPTAPTPPSAGSRSSGGTPPNIGLRRGLEEPVAREPRSVLTPLQAPGQEAAVRGLREATEADRRLYPPDEERLKRDAAREAREADLRRREAICEAEEEQQRWMADAEAQTLQQVQEAERRRREQEAAEAAQRVKAQAEAREQEKEERRRQEELERRRQREAEERRRREKEEATRKAEEERKQREEEEHRLRMQEAERKQHEAAEFEKQREAFEAERRRLEAKEAEELARERREAEERQREAEREVQPEEKEKETCEVVSALIALRRKYGKEDPEGLATCLKTLGTYISNLAKNPQDQKFQRINTENAAFQKRVAVFEGSTAVLRACGFGEEGTSLVVDTEFLRTKGPRLFDAAAKIDVLVAQLKSGR